MRQTAAAASRTGASAQARGLASSSNWGGSCDARCNGSLWPQHRQYGKRVSKVRCEEVVERTKSDRVGESRGVVRHVVLCLESVDSGVLSGAVMLGAGEGE